MYTVYAYFFHAQNMKKKTEMNKQHQIVNRDIFKRRSRKYKIKCSKTTIFTSRTPFIQCDDCTVYNDLFVFILHLFKTWQRIFRFKKQGAHGPHRSPEQQCLIIKKLELIHEI